MMARALAGKQVHLQVSKIRLEKGQNCDFHVMLSVKLKAQSYFPQGKMLSK